jgi:septum formation inhibitor-activating ATPase MinD
MIQKYQMTIGDFLFQLITFILLLGILFAVYFAVRSLVIKTPENSKNIEQKLDRIIELLEKDKKN